MKQLMLFFFILLSSKVIADVPKGKPSFCVNYETVRELTAVHNGNAVSDVQITLNNFALAQFEIGFNINQISVVLNRGETESQIEYMSYQIIINKFHRLSFQISSFLSPDDISLTISEHRVLSQIREINQRHRQDLQQIERRIINSLHT